jgi:arylsulfatase
VFLLVWIYRSLPPSSPHIIYVLVFVVVKEEQYQEGMRNYHALISNVDDASREIVDELKRQGLYESTLIIFTCDNGMMLGRHGLAGKWHPFEESIRVPLIIYDPRLPPDHRGKVDHHLTLNVDLATTILGAAGLPPSPTMQGRDIADLYLSSTAMRRPTAATTKFESSTTTAKGVPWREDFYYDFPLGDIGASTSLVSKKWKYMKFERQGGIEKLFDLEKDPYELEDYLIASDNNNQTLIMEILRTLKDRYQQLKEEVTNNDGFLVTPCDKKEKYYP